MAYGGEESYIQGTLSKWMKKLVQNLDSDIEEKTMSPKNKKIFEKISNMFFQTNEKHRKSLGYQLAEVNAGLILTEYFKAMTSCGKISPTDGYRTHCLKIVKSICLSYSNVSHIFCLELGKAGLFLYLVEDLHASHDGLDGQNVRDLVYGSLGILYNCSKVPENRKYFKQAEAIEAIHPYTKTKYQMARVISMLTLAYLIEEKDKDLIATNDHMIKSIHQYLKLATGSSDHCTDGFSAEEIIDGLTHLAYNDRNKSKIVNEGILPIAVELLQNGNTSEQTVSAKLIWRLSFSDENKSKILEEGNLMNILNELADLTGILEDESDEELSDSDSEDELFAYMNEEDSDGETNSDDDFEALEEAMKGALSLHARPKKSHEESDGDRRTSVSLNERREVKMAAEGALWVLKENKAFVEEKPDSVNKTEKGQLVKHAEKDESTSAPPSSPKHIMISYAWKHQEIAIKIKDYLEKRRYRVWIDVEKMKGNILKKMAEAVENSEVILLLVSEAYKNSLNCETEANYAYRLKKCLVPVRVEQDYVPDSWLGALEGLKYYHDVSNEDLFDSRLSKLVDELGERGKYGSDDVVDGPILPKERGDTHKPIKDWDKNDVTKWSTEKQISFIASKNLTGKYLVFLHSTKKSAPEYFFKLISEKLEITELEEVEAFCSALEDLNL